MNEHYWLNCDDSIPMLDFLLASRGDTAQRKLRLFACACVRRTGEFGGRKQLKAIRLSEQFADGLVNQAALEDAFIAVRQLPKPIPFDADMALSVFGPTDMAWESRLVELLDSLGPEVDVRAVATKAAKIIIDCEGAVALSRRGKDEPSQQAHLLREIFGNPFRPVTLDPSCLTDSTRSVAKTIYVKGEFAKLSLLAKALKKDPGCTNKEVRDHCQWPIPHVRGCWVLDLVLGKS